MVEGRTARERLAIALLMLWAVASKSEADNASCSYGAELIQTHLYLTI